MKNTSTKPRTSSSKEPTPVAADVGQRKPSGGLNTQEHSASNDRHHTPQVKRSSDVESDRLEGQRDQSARNGAVTDRPQTTEHGVHAFRDRLLTTAALALSILLLVGPTSAAQFDQCEIVAADSCGKIYAFSPRTGERTIITDQLRRPYKMVLSCDGNLLASDTESLQILKVNRLSGDLTVVAENPAIGVPYGFDENKKGHIFLANSLAILRIDQESGFVDTNAQGGFLKAPLDVAVAPDGSLWVADAVAGVIHVDPLSKRQTLVAHGQWLRNPVTITLNGNRTAYVSDLGNRCVVAINLHDGSQKLVSMGGFLTTPLFIALGPGGTMLVSDPDTLQLDGGILSIGQDGTQQPIFRGFGDCTNPRGIVFMVGNY